MKEKGIPSQYPPEDGMSFVEISKQFNASKYGEILRSNVRYWTFKPEDIQSSQWEKLLGADVNNLNHLQVSLGIAKSFLTHCETPGSSWKGEVPQEATFSRQEKATLQLTALVHDWGEAIIGDIPMPQKTKDDEEREMVALRGIVYDVLGNKGGRNFCEEASSHVIEVLTDTSSKLGKAFNAIEQVGYARTGLRAWKESKKADGPIKSALENLTDNVVPNAVSKLVSYADVYPAVDTYLTYHTKNVDQIFEEMQDKNIIYYQEAKRQWDHRTKDNRG